MKLAGVGHPFIHQDQAGPVLHEELPEDIPGAGGEFVVLGDAGEGLLAAKLIGQFTPHRVDHGAIGLGHRVAGGDFVPHQHHPISLGEGLHASFSQHRVHSRELAGADPREQVVEGQHRVGLAAAEVGLELDHRVAAGPGHPLDASHQQALEAVGEVGPPEELSGLPILVAAFAQVDLPEVRGELRLLVTATGHIGMRGYDLAPGLKGRGGCGFDEHRAGLTLLLSGLLLEDETAQFILYLANLVRLGRRNGRQHTVNGIQSPVGIVAGEGLLVGPLIPPVSELLDE